MPERKYKEKKQKKGVKECLKLLATGELHVEDVEEFEKEIAWKPELGDHIQFELYRYCQKDPSQTDADLIVRLAELCYSPTSVLNFTNIERFVGCVNYISTHLLKKERFESALNVNSCLFIRKNEILEESKEKTDLRTFFHNSHSSFMASATALAATVKSLRGYDYQICHRLAVDSLKVFTLTNVQQPRAGRKVIRSSMLYLQTLKYYRKEDVLDFYDRLIDVLDILLPSMRTRDYFLLYYLLKMSQLHKPDGEVHQELKGAVSLLTVFLKSSSTVKNILQKILDFFWVECREENWITGEEFEVLRDGPDSDLYCVLVSTIVSHGVQFLWTKFSNGWCENVSVRFVQNLSGTVMALHRCLGRNWKLYCPSEVCFGDLFNGNLQKIQYIVRLCLKNKVPNALSLVSYSCEAFELSMECLANMKSMGCCDRQRACLWKSSVIHHTNTVEDIVRIPPSEKAWHYLRKCSHDILREIVDSDAELPFDFARVKVLFQRWHNASLKLKNYQEALYICVVFYVFYPKAEEEIASMWLQTKSESANEIIQEMTVTEVLKTCDQKLRDFSKTYKGSNCCLMKSALFFELKAYGACLPDTFQNPQSPYNLTTRIWKQLEKWTLDAWESSLAMSSLIAASIAGDTEKLPVGFHKKCQKLIDTFLEQGRKDKTRYRSLLHAGNLTFSLFLYNVKTAELSEGKTDSSEMVLGHLKKVEEERVKFGEDVDLNLTCDVIPSSRRLTVELETNHVQELDNVVNIWSDVLKGDLQDAPSDSEFDLWLRNVRQAAIMYEMFGEYQRAVSAWLMLYRIGKLCNNPEASMLGLSHLIRSCSDVDESGLKDEAELVSRQLGTDTADRQALVEYSLAMASNHLRNTKPEKCLERLTAAKKILECFPLTIKSSALSAKFWSLVGQFLVVHTDYETAFEFPAGMDIRVVYFRAFSYATGGARTDLIKSATQSDCMELVLTMLDVNLWSYHLHGVYRQTDFMRLFLGDLYQIVQRLFLPTRTAEVLARLAEVDMMCQKGPDCQEKVVKLKSILTASSPVSGGQVVKVERSPSSHLTIPQQNLFENAMARPISPVRFLNDCPQSKGFDLSPMQYYLARDSKAPRVAEHAKKCKCRLCQNMLVQTLVMDTLRLEGDIYSLKEDSKEAASCYARACKVLGSMETVREEQSEATRLELASTLREDPGVLELRRGFVHFYGARFLINYARFELVAFNAVTESALKTLHRITKLMRGFTHEKKLLQWTFAEVKLFCVLLGKTDDKQRPKKTSAPIANTPMACPPVTPAVAQTRREPVADRRKIPSGEDRSDDELNTAFIETDNSKVNQPVIRPRKLNFDANEPETVTGTVKKPPRDRINRIHSRKLDFDASADLFDHQQEEEEVEAAAEAEAKAETASALTNTARKTATGRRKREPTTVNVYVDGEEGDGGRSNGGGRKAGDGRSSAKRSTRK